MLKISVGLVPRGFEPLRRAIATMQISNESNLAKLSDCQSAGDGRATS
jgi:hypothetical protein